MCEFSEALIEQGREEGIEQGVTRVAQNLLAMHTPVEVVVNATKLSQAEVEKLAKEIK